MEEDREYTMLMEGMQYCLQEVRRSNFYANLVHQIKDKSAEIFSNLTEVVVYGIGNIQYSYAAKFQLSLALLLREVEGIHIHKEITICCDDMTLTPSEEKAIKAYGCRLVLMTDGRFRWTVDESYTLFFLPFTRPEVLGDLLEMNWCPSQLGKMMILGTSLSFMAEDLDEFVSYSDGGRPKMTTKKLSYVRDRLRYIWGIKGHIRELEIKDCGLSSVDKSESYNPEEMFEDLCWHMFDVDGVEDMNTLLPSTEICFKWVDSDMSYPYRMDEEDAEEFLKLQEDMKITIMELRESEYYRKLRDQLEEDNLLKREVSRRLGSEEKMEMVIYALGDLEYHFNSHYQLALALLLREEVDMLKIGEIQVFDPSLTPADVNVIRSFGCIVLSINEFARRRVEKPTLFFLPFACFDLVANLLEANWSPSQLENLIILGSSLHVWGKTREERPDVITLEESETEKLISNDRLRYIRTIREWSVEFVIDDGHQWRPFRRICWVFINLHSRIDLNSLLPGFPIIISKIQVDHGRAELACDYISDLRECMEEFHWKPFKPDSKLKTSFSKGNQYRGPSKHCKTWSPPPPGWFKLNFDGYGYGYGPYYGYGGTLYNHEGELLFSYAGPMTSADTTIQEAQVEGMRKGAQCFKQWMLPLLCEEPKLIIEGSALSVIRWANGQIPPPVRFVEEFKEMSTVLENTNCIVFHIYEEANTKANEIAKLGLTLSEFRFLEIE